MNKDKLHIGCDKGTGLSKSTRTILIIGAGRRNTLAIEEARFLSMLKEKDQEQLKEAAIQMGISIRQLKEAMEHLAKIAEMETQRMQEANNTLRQAALKLKQQSNRNKQKIKTINQEQKRLQNRHFQRSKW